MKLSVVKEVIYGRPKCFRVNFERKMGAVYGGDHFPERTEKPFKTEATAWRWAKKFAEATGPDIVNIYVIDEN